MSYSNLTDVISVSTRIDPHIRMQKYNSNWTSQTNWFDHAGIHCLGFKPEPLNSFESIEAIHNAIFEEEPLEAYFWEQSTTPYCWNTYWTDATIEGGGLDINDPVFRPHWTRYSGAHSWFPCDPEDPCDCEGHNCAGTHLTIVHAAAAATTAKSLEILLIFVVPSTPTPSKLDKYYWHWLMYLTCCDVRIRPAGMGGPGVRRWPGPHSRNRQHEHTGDRLLR